MSKYYLTLLVTVFVGIVFSEGYKTTNLEETSELNHVRRYSEEPGDIQINGKDSADGTNQGTIATYWNNFLKRARLPLPSLNITNPLTNIITPYFVEVENSQQPQVMNEKPHLILLDPATQQYYRVKPVLRS